MRFRHRPTGHTTMTGRTERQILGRRLEGTSASIVRLYTRSVKSSGPSHAPLLLKKPFCLTIPSIAFTMAV